MKKKIVKKTAVKKTEKVNDPVVSVVVATAPETTSEEKPRVIFAPEVEKTESGSDAAPQEVPAVNVEAAVTSAPVIATSQTPEANVDTQPLVESSPVVATSVIEEVKNEPAKFEVPAGELARSIETLSKIVDQDQPVSPEPGADTSADLVTSVKKRRGGGGGALGVLLAFVIGLCLGLIAGYGLWGRYVSKGISDLLGGGGKVQQQEVVVSPTPVVTPTPEVMVMARKDLKVKVLNGTGGRGVAALGQEYLEELGYVEVEVGNAKRSDYEVTEVVLATTKTGYWPLLKADLEGKYTVVDGFATDDALLEANGGVDALVIIGE